MTNMKKATSSSHTDLSDLTRNGRAREMYHAYRNKVMAWTVKRFHVSGTEAGELYQEAFIICYYQVRSGRLTEIRCDPGTYLIGIIKNLMKQQRSHQPFLSLDDVPDTSSVSNIAEKEIAEAYNILRVQQLLDRIQDPCRTLLKLFYQQRFSLEAIASRLGYKNANVVKKKKSQCLKKLRDLHSRTNQSEE